MELMPVSIQQPFPWILIAGSVLLTILVFVAETRSGRRLASAIPAVSLLLAFLRIDHKPNVNDDPQNGEHKGDQIEEPSPVELIGAPFENARERLRRGAKRAPSHRQNGSQVRNECRITNTSNKIRKALAPNPPA